MATIVTRPPSAPAASGVPHSHRDRRAPEDPLKRENVPSPHHVMAGEGVSEDVRHLARRIESTTLIGATDGGAAGHEQAAGSRHAHLEHQVLQLGRDRYRAALTILRPVVVGLSPMHSPTSDAPGFFPAAPVARHRRATGHVWLFMLALHSSRSRARHCDMRK